MQALGVASQEMMSRALANMVADSPSTSNEAFYIRRGSVYVNEYARVDCR